MVTAMAQNEALPNDVAVATTENESGCLDPETALRLALIGAELARVQAAAYLPQVRFEVPRDVSPLGHKTA